MVWSRKALNIEGYVHNIYSGLQNVFTYCNICDKYTWHIPLSKYPDYKYVCDNCNCYSEQTQD